ncbi:MAG: NYN domain-containing protein [Candidatus Saccharibacteria bacterium]|nr:NYN domain-containing protein [Candidatus Saccharibacteria bacterium]
MRNIVYVDGQNFLYKAAEILIKKGMIGDKQELTALDIRFLFENIFPEEDLRIRFFGVTKIKRRYDLGEEILNKSVRFSDNLRRVRNSLNSQRIDYVEVGKLKIRDSDVCKNCGRKDYRFQEKGVDVGLAVGIVRDALKDEVDRIILASSDTDLIPAVLLAKNEGKDVIYVGFDDRLTQALVAKSSSTQVIRDTEVVEAYKRKNH